MSEISKLRNKFPKNSKEWKTLDGHRKLREDFLKKNHEDVNFHKNSENFK